MQKERDKRVRERSEGARGSREVKEDRNSPHRSHYDMSGAGTEPMQKLGIVRADSFLANNSDLVIIFTVSLVTCLPSKDAETLDLAFWHGIRAEGYCCNNICKSKRSRHHCLQDFFHKWGNVISIVVFSVFIFEIQL